MVSDEEVSASLPCPAWVQFIDLHSGTPYFYNVATKEVSWLDPDEDHERDECPSGESNDRPLLEDAASHQSAACAVSMPREDDGSKRINARLEMSWLDRPARIQKKYEPGKVQYTEGSENFNVYYGKFDSERFRGRDPEPAPTKCNPVTDCGWTHADSGASVNSFFCIFFAQGRCSLGHQCNYHHHVPTPEEAQSCDVAHDIFGRVRFESHREDMDGIGTFNSDCQTLFVGGLQFDRAANDALQAAERDIIDGFSTWGEIESIKIIPGKAVAFIRFKYRASAEFAKAAMANQRVGLSEMVQIRWAFEDKNPMVAKRRRIERHQMMCEAADRKLARLGLSEIELATIALSHQDRRVGDSVTAPYPGEKTERSTPVASCSLALARETRSPAPTVIGPPTSKEVEAAAMRSKTVANVDRMNSVLAKIEAMHSMGAISPPTAV
jgi:hypothetical protein|eukprot:TRINITY_DN74766_c0_g1_i1.p1 TRINITY_DN74766_c0_g1~~TRINITY_DN74766_c0_g1_i1.p1  ORF type:complete len:439 (+),score=62.47 TRINITY_DN74766_c0_g1_i1:89-1405(+)